MTRPPLHADEDRSIGRSVSADTECSKAQSNLSCSRLLRYSLNVRNAYMLGVTHGRSKPIPQTLGHLDRYGRCGLAVRVRADPRTYDRRAADSQRQTCGVLLRSSGSPAQGRRQKRELGPNYTGCTPANRGELFFYYSAPTPLSKKNSQKNPFSVSQCQFWPTGSD